MMTLDEAIKHCEEVAEKQKEKGFLANTEANRSTVYGEKCYRCASEHRQLADWLKELKRYKEQKPILDKIRSEVINLTDGDIPERIWNVDVLEIIDKYKAESEAEDENNTSTGERTRTMRLM